LQEPAQPILDDSGNVEQYFAMIEDATEKKLHEENTAQRKRKIQ
jgi:hypothetical protein